MMKLTVLAIVFLAALDHSVALDIKQQRNNGICLIETSPTNYGIASSSMETLGWKSKSITVNGNNVTLTKSECDLTIKSYDALSETEKSLIVDAKNQLSTRQGLIEDIKFLSVDPTQLNTGMVFNGNTMTSYNSMRTYTSGGLQHNGDRSSFFKMDENNYSITMIGLPANLGRVFVNNGIVTFVNIDGQVLMKPIACLQPSEQQLIEQFKVEIQKVEEQYKQDMEQMERDMENMRQDMAKMDEDMKRMNEDMKKSDSLNTYHYSEPYFNFIGNGQVDDQHEQNKETYLQDQEINRQDQEIYRQDQEIYRQDQEIMRQDMEQYRQDMEQYERDMEEYRREMEETRQYLEKSNIS